MKSRLWLLSSGSQQKPVLPEECLVKTELLILSPSLALSFQEQPLNPLQQGSFSALQDKPEVSTADFFSWKRLENS